MAVKSAVHLHLNATNHSFDDSQVKMLKRRASLKEVSKKLLLCSTRILLSIGRVDFGICLLLALASFAPSLHPNFKSTVTLTHRLLKSRLKINSVVDTLLTITQQQRFLEQVESSF